MSTGRGGIVEKNPMTGIGRRNTLLGKIASKNSM